jgi:hypothetical protein
MFRYKLRTLLVVLAIGPPVLAWGWRESTAYQRREAFRAYLEVVRARVLARPAPRRPTLQMVCGNSPSKALGVKNRVPRAARRESQSGDVSPHSKKSREILFVGGNNWVCLRIYTLAAGPRLLVFDNSGKMAKCGCEAGSTFDQAHIAQ